MATRGFPSRRESAPCGRRALSSTSSHAALTFPSSSHSSPQNMSRLLINEEPLQVLPGLAEKIGLNEAIVLQQLHYWLSRSTQVKEGEKWVYNTYDEWCAQFPFWSKATVRRVFTSLEKQGLIIT